jgi:hypothetical protein
METKKCKLCEEDKSLNEFYKMGKNYSSRCKKCFGEYQKNNPNRKEIEKKCREKNKEILKEKRKKRYYDDVEKTREYNRNLMKKCRAENPEKYKEYSQSEKNKQYQKEYREKNKEKQKQYIKDYYLKNMEKMKEMAKNYRLDNIDNVKKRKKEYYNDNRDNISQKGKSYYENNKEKIKNRTKLYVEKNRENVNKAHREWKKKNKDKIRKKNKNNINYLIACRLRNRFSNIIRRNNYSKSGKTIELLGCSFNQFKDYFQSKFTEGMTWELFMIGNIHIDHIRPCSSFNLSNEEEQKICFHYTNLQPLWKTENLKKGKKWKEETTPPSTQPTTTKLSW